MLKKYRSLIISLILPFIIPFLSSLTALIFAGYIRSHFLSHLIIPLLIGISGVGMYIFIKSFVIKEESLITLGIAICYSLSGYITSYGFNLKYLFAAAIFPYIMWGLLLFIKNDKPYPYIILTLITSLINSWLCIMISIFSGLYMLINLPSFNPKAIRKCILKVIFDISLILLFVPIHFDLFITNREMLSNTNLRTSRFLNFYFPTSRMSGNFFDVLKSLLSGTRPSNTLVYGYGIDICCGAFVIFLATCYLLNKNVSLRERISNILLTLLLLIACVYDTANYFFNGFHYTDDNKTYFGFMTIFMLLLISAKELKIIDKNHPVTLIFSYLISFAVLILSALYSTHYDSFKPFIYTAELLIFYGVTVLLLKSKNLTKKLFSIGFSLIMIGESMVFSFNNINSYVKNEKQDITDYVASVIEDKTSDKDYKVLILDNDEMSVEPVFNSLYGYDYIAEPALELTKNNKGTPLPSAELSEKDLINPGDEVISIYKNPYSLHGFYIPADTAILKYYDDQYFKYINEITTSVMSYYAPDKMSEGSTTSKEYNIYKLLQDDSSFSFIPQVSVDKNNHIDPNKDRIATLFMPNEGGTFYNHINSTHYMGDKKPEETIFLTEDISIRRSLEQCLYAQYATFDLDKFLEFYNSIKRVDNPYLMAADTDNSSNADHNSSDADHNSASDNSRNPSFYYVTDIPYKYGMSLYINGENRESTSVLNGLLAVPVYEKDFINGSPEFKISYKNRYPMYSLFILISLTLFFMAIKLYFKESTKKLDSFVKENYVYLSVVLISSLVLLIVMFIRTCYPFGNNSLYIGDGFYQGLSGYIDNMRSIKNGKYSILRYNMGLISDNTLGVYDLILSPIRIVTAKLMPEALYEFTFVLGKILPFIFGGVSLCFYLIHRRNRKNMSKQDPRLIAFGLSFALSSYAISYFVYSGFGFITYIPLMILALERLIYDKKISFYILLLYLFIGDPYYGFMMCVFLFLYFFTMEFKSFKDFFFKGLRFGLSSIAAAGLHAYSLLPYYLGTLDHSYKINDSRSPSFTNWTSSIVDVIADNHAFHPAVITTSDTSRVNSYAGLFILLIFTLYFFIKKIPLHERIGRGLIIILYFMSFMNEGLNYILHGFHYQSLVPNRFSIFLVFLMIVSAYDVILNWEELSARIKFLIPTVTFIFIATSFLLANKTINKLGKCISLSLGVIYIITIIITTIKSGKDEFINCSDPSSVLSGSKERKFSKIFAVLLIFELFLSSLYTFYGAAGMDMSLRHLPELEALVDRHEDAKDPFVMTEVMDINLVNSQNFLGVNSISGFSSSFSMTNMAMLDRYNIHTSSNIIGYISGNPIADMFLRVKYFIVDTGTSAFSSPYPVVDREYKYELHLNSHALCLGTFIDKNEALTEYDAALYDSSVYSYSGTEKKYETAFDMQNAFAKCFEDEDLYKKVDLLDKSSEIKITEADNYYEIFPDESDKAYMIAQVHVNDTLKGHLYIAVNNGINYVGLCNNKEDDLYIRLPKVNTKNISFGILNEDVYENLYERFSKYQMYDITTTSSGIQGKIDAPSEGTVFISLPHLYGFSVTIDGKEASIKDFMGGMGIDVTPGSHTLTLSYKRANMKPGYIITGLTILMLIIFNYIKSKKTKKSVENE